MTRHRRADIYARVLAFALVANGSIAEAQEATPAASAQTLFDDAKRLMGEKRYAEACPKLEESQRLDPGSGTLINLADCYEHVGKLATAYTAFKQAEASARAVGNAPREQVARERAAALEPRLPRIKLEVTAKAPGLEIQRDGSVIGAEEWRVTLPVDPGEHTIRASAPGRQAWERRVLAQEGVAPVVVAVPELPALSSQAPVVEPAPLAAEVSATRGGLGVQRTLAIAAGGVGVVGIVVGSIYGLKSASKHDEADPDCDDYGNCNGQKAYDAAEEAVSAGNVSTLAFVLGGAALAGGAVLWFTAPSQETRASAAVGIGPGTLTLRAKW